MMDYQLNCQCVILLTLFARTVSVQFHVLGPANPIVAVPGGDIVLPCFLKPSISAVDFRVQWNLLNTVVHHYQNHTDQYNTQNPSFEERTSLFKEELQTGNTSLKLTGVKLSDEGRYKCFVQSQDSFEDVLMDVFVQAVGSQPEINVERNLEHGFTLMCESKGWYPKPEVVWQDGEGKTFPTELPEAHQDSEGFYTVKLFKTVKEGDPNYYICKVQQQQTSQVKMTEIWIPDEMFRLYNPWKTAVIVLSVLFAIFVMVLSKLYGKARKLRKRAYNETDLKRKQRLYAVNDVTFDQETTNLNISERGRRATYTESCANCNDGPTVLGKKFKRKGAFYYKLWMRGASNCKVGIMRGHSNNCENTGNEIFSVRLTDKDVVLGIYVRIHVNCGWVTVYNTYTEREVGSITWNNHCENHVNMSLYPFFGLSKEWGGSMFICNLEGATHSASLTRRIYLNNGETEAPQNETQQDTLELQPINQPDAEDILELQPINQPAVQDTLEHQPINQPDEEKRPELQPIKPPATNSELEQLINQLEKT